MKKKWVIGKKDRRVLLIFQKVLAAAFAAIFVGLACNSSVSVERNGRLYEQQINLLENSNSFENSDLFTDILSEEIRGVTRLSVIRSQLETDGTYNGQKQIDIAEFAHRQEDVRDTTATASFYLDDLVKWGNYGFVTEKVFATKAQLDAYFKGDSSVFSGQEGLSGNDWNGETATLNVLQKLDQKRQKQSLSMQMIQELPSSREEYQKKCEELGLNYSDADGMELDLLVPRYLSAEGKDLAQYASDTDEYIQLRDDLKTTSKELFYNFSEYSAYKDSYGLDASNIRYCYRMDQDGEVHYYTNLKDDFTDKKLDEITRQFEEYGRYLCYNADRAELLTNTEIAADKLRQELSSYQYAFGDNTRVWLAVDTTYPAQDSFATARAAYHRVVPYYGYLAAAGMLFLVVSVWLLLRVTRYEGRVRKEGGGYQIELRIRDTVLTEPFVAAGILMMGMILGVSWLLYLLAQTTLTDVTHAVWFPFAVGVVAFLLDDVFLFFYLSLVRRARAHTLWSNSMLRLIFSRIGNGVLRLYDNGHILVRSLLPFLLLLAGNLILGGCGVVGILIAAVIDIIAILVLYSSKKDLQQIVDTAVRLGHGDLDLKVDLSDMHGENRELAEAVNGIGDGIKTAVEKSMKDERLKADLITNVSHDIKTPLTSIINFVNLLKREQIDNERAKGYIQVLDAKSQRLKQLTDDLVEASKITSGNISLQMERLDFKELVKQTCGEFDDKLKEKCLEMIVSLPPEPVYIEADPRRIWRVVENLFSNVCKYALEGTRVYLEIRRVRQDDREIAVFTMKNISAQALNIRAEELTERFIRGDISRSTEGSGLGLSIAQNLTTLQKGTFEIYLDGDLFKVQIGFSCLDVPQPEIEIQMR